jgi:hypothetical protein
LADRLLDRDLQVDAVQVVKVDVVEPEPLQAGLDRLPRRHRRGAGPAQLAMRELAGDHQLVALSRQRFPKQRLVVPRAIAAGGVEEGDPELDRAMQGPGRLRVVGRALDAGKPHAAISLAADGQVSEFRHAWSPAAMKFRRGYRPAGRAREGRNSAPRLNSY